MYNNSANFKVKVRGSLSQPPLTFLPSFLQSLLSYVNLQDKYNLKYAQNEHIPDMIGPMLET